MDPRQRRMIELHEGRIPYAYQDSLKYWTIGVGHLVDERRGGRLPDHIIDALLDHDLEVTEKELDRALPWAKALDPVRRAVLIDMTFNLGIEPFDGDGNRDWPIFVGQVRDGLYEDAAHNMLSTLWARQVGQRARRLAEMMRSGQWPSDV